MRVYRGWYRNKLIYIHAYSCINTENIDGSSVSSLSWVLGLEDINQNAWRVAPINDRTQRNRRENAGSNHMSLSSVVPLHSNPIIKIIFLALHLFLPFLPSPSAILFCVFTVTLCQFSFAFYLMLLFFNAFHPFFSFIFLFVFHLWPWFTQYLCNISSCFQTLCSFANWIYSCRPLRHVLCTDVLGRRQTKIWIKRIETNKKRFRRLFSPWLICQKISHGTFTLSIFFRPPPPRD